MRTAIMLAIALAAMPALAQPRLDVPVTITTTPMTTPVCFFFFCGLPLDVVPDGAGGFVPFTNSRVMPDGSLRPYDPAIDGLPPDGHGVAAFFTPPPMPEPPPEHYYDPPRRPSPARPFHWRDPNPSSEAVPDTRDLRTAMKSSAPAGAARPRRAVKIEIKSNCSQVRAKLKTDAWY